MDNSTDTNKHYTTCLYCGAHTWRQGKAYGGDWGGYQWDLCSISDTQQDLDRD
jgi:hypothetical protein